MEKIEFEQKLFDAIKKDDVKSFTFLMPTNSDLNLCYGRFPILSLLYLYSSFKILAKFEKKLMSIRSFNVTQEKFEMYKKFRKVAGKSLRLFEDEKIIYPIEMLAVLNEKIILENNYKFLYKNVEITQNLQKIYTLNNKKITFYSDGSVKISAERLSSTSVILSACICVVFAIIMTLSSLLIVFISNTSGLGLKNNPIKISSAQELGEALEKGKRNYILTSDITVKVNELTAEKFAGKLDCKNYTISIDGEIGSPLVKNLTGTIENLNIKLLSNKIKITQNSAIISENLTGNIKNCKISGNFELEFNADEEAFVGLFAAVNDGVIQNSETNISGTLTNNKESNAYFSAFVGLNKENGKIENCKANNGSVIADTVDISGIAAENYGEITNCQNYVSLSQTSEKDWHPNVAGVAIQNYGVIDACKNYAELESIASLKLAKEENSVYYVFVAGISCENYNKISNSRNFGKIIGTGNISNIVAGGIVSQNGTDEEYVGKVESSLCKADIVVKSETGQVCVGGVAGMNASSVASSGYEGVIDATTNSDTDKQLFMNKVDKVVVLFAGGIVGVNQSGELKNSYANAEFLAGGAAIVANEEGQAQKLYAGIAASVGIYAFLEAFSGSYITGDLDNITNNYYVEKTDIKSHAYGVYATTLGGYYQSGTLQEITDSVLIAYFKTSSNVYMIKCSNFNDIPAEVRIDE